MKSLIKFSFALGIFLVMLTAPTRASDSYRLRCDGDTFEAPMRVKVIAGRASAEASWDGPGSAIFQANYSDLAAFTRGGELTVLQSRTVRLGERTMPDFYLVLRGRAGRFHGKLHVLSNDGQGMTYDGEVSCILDQ